MNPHIIEAMHDIPRTSVPADSDDAARRRYRSSSTSAALSAGELASQHRLLYEFLLNKWYFDELYDLIFVRPAKGIGRFLWKQGDGYVIDGFGPDGVSARVLM